MLKVFSKIEDVKQYWGVTSPNFLHIDFLSIYFQHHKKIKHLFVVGNDVRIYAHIFKLTFKLSSNYLQNNSIANIILRFINFDVFYVTNSFITNVPAFIADKEVVLKDLLEAIKDNHSIIVIPDFLFDSMVTEDKYYTKIEVEEEMVLSIKKDWNELEDYMLDLKKKYRNKLKSILKRTSNMEIRPLSPESLEDFAFQLRVLFKQVALSSQFQGPDFNTDSLAAFVRRGFMKVEGYFLNDKLVGFSSEIQQEEKLYSYFVGFDKELNKSVPIYGRILLQNIASAIRQKKGFLVLGRTANEYKSNFGAQPIRSHIYLKVENRFLRTILKPVYSRIGVKRWRERRPFKIKDV